MSLNERYFESWGYAQHQELIRLCGVLPVLPREKVDTFFAKAERVAEDSRVPKEWPAAMLFSSLGSTLAASDRQDLDVRWLLGSGSITDGILMVETHDPVLAVLQCVARLSEDSFLTRVFAFNDIAAVKRLVGGSAAELQTQSQSPTGGRPLEEETEYCPQCGNPNGASARFCMTCGMDMAPFRLGVQGVRPNPSEAQPAYQPQHASQTYEPRPAAPPASLQTAPYQMPGYPPAGMAPYSAAPARIKSYLGWAIATLILCFWPTGIVAVVHAVRVGNRLSAGDYRGAQESSRKAKWWSQLSFNIAVAFVVIVVVIAIFGTIVTRR